MRATHGAVFNYRLLLYDFAAATLTAKLTAFRERVKSLIFDEIL